MKLRIVSAAVLASLTGGLWLLAQVKDFRPITEAMLRNPAPGDWIVWRRTDNGWGYSPLDQIKRDNVQRLQQAWSWVMEDGAQEPTPLVYDGVMYLPNPHVSFRPWMLPRATYCGNTGRKRGTWRPRRAASWEACSAISRSLATGFSPPPTTRT